MKQIEGYEYLIDTHGNIKSLLTGKMLKLTVFKNGYKCVSLRKNMKTIKHYVHRLVAQTFIPNPDGKRTVNHKDGNTLNNCIDNLEWYTDSEQQYHAYDTLNRTNGMIGKENTTSFVPIEQYTMDGEFIAEYQAIKLAVLATGIERRAIGNCVNGKTKSSGGFVWKKKS
jgi:hypothetical protein